MKIKKQKNDKWKVDESFTHMLYEHGDDTATVCYTDNILSRDVDAVHSFIKEKGMISHGMFLFYAVNHSKKKIVLISLTRSYPEKKDIKSLAENGYDEFFVSNSFATKKFRLPSGDIVGVAAEVDATPQETSEFTHKD